MIQIGTHSSYPVQTQMKTGAALAKRITTQEANLKTVTVEVKALTLSGKQMTLAVFRQLQNEPLIDRETGQLNGIPWGRVNYNWDDCSPAAIYGQHLHVVWQKENELCRACVFDSPTAGWHGLPNIAILSAWRSCQACRVIRWVLEGKVKDSANLEELTFPFFGRQYIIIPYQNLEYKMVSSYLHAKRYFDHRSEESRKQLEVYLADNEPSSAEEQLIKQEFETYVRTWKESYAAIASTEQLFIAI